MAPQRSIVLAKLYERKMSGGRVHLTGQMGLSRLLLVPSGSTNDGTGIFTLFLCESEAPAAKPTPIERAGSAVSARQKAEAQFRRRP